MSSTSQPPPQQQEYWKEKVNRDLACQKNELFFWFDGAIKVKNEEIDELKCECSELKCQNQSLNEELSHCMTQSTLTHSQYDHMTQEMWSESERVVDEWSSLWQSVDKRVQNLLAWKVPTRGLEQAKAILNSL